MKEISEDSGNYKLNDDLLPSKGCVVKNTGHSTYS